MITQERAKNLEAQIQAQAKRLEKQSAALKMAKDALESCDIGDYSTGHVITPSFDAVAVYGAIAAIDALGE